MIRKPRFLLIILLLCAMLLFLSVFPVGAIADEDLYAASYKTYDTTYDDILKMYLRVMPAQCRNQSRRRHDLYNEYMYADLSPYYMEGVMTPEYDALDEAGKSKKLKELQEKTLSYMKSTVGYAILDINGDGIDELLIGKNKAYIYEAFTMDGGKVRELIKAGYRSPCSLLNDGTFFRQASLGGDRNTNTLFSMNGTDKVLFIKGYLASDENWFRMDNSKDTASGAGKLVPESEAKTWIAECESNLSDIRFIPFAAYEKGMSGDGIAVFAKDGKTSGSQKIRIRKAPDNKSKIIAQKSVGTFVKATGMEGDYYRVTVGNKTGYVHKDYLILLTDLPKENAEE